MKSVLHLTAQACCIGLLTTSSTLAQGAAEEAAIEAILEAELAKIEGQAPKNDDVDSEDEATSSRVFLTNGDKLRGLPLQIDAEKNLLFESDSLRQTAAFPVENVLSLNLDSWKPRKRPDTLARITLQPRFRETSSDILLGSLQELTPESIKLDTWYGETITLKRSMVQSLNIINNRPGSYFGPNNLKEWALSNGKGTWQFQNGALVSRSQGGAGRDIGLREKSHISFDVTWEKSMRFRIQLYSSDITDDSPDAYYDVNFNRNYAFLRTHGKTGKAMQRIGGGRWQQIRTQPDTNRAHFDIYANRKAGTFSVYIDGVRACMLQSLTPDPENLGTGLSFIAEERYPIEISGITVTPWNGTSLPNQIKDIEAEIDQNQDSEPDDAQEEDPESEKEKKLEPPHKIVLNNGDEVPGTVGKVQDGRMIIETEYTPIHIPVDRIKSLSLGDKGEEPKKYAGDVRAWFHQGGYITLKLNALKDGKISGYSQAVGDVTLDLSAFNRIDFHIYNKTANELRAEMR